MESMAEKREFLRADISVFLTEENCEAMTLARATDISERGIHYIMPLGPVPREPEALFIEFCLPDDLAPVRARGRVVSDLSQEQTTGRAIEFTRLSSQDAERIRRYVGRPKRAELMESLRQEHLLN